MNKKELRIFIKNRLLDFSKNFINESIRINKDILQSPFYKNCDVILAYMALKDEPDLSLIISDALNHNKKVFLPKVCTRTEQMDFYEYTKESQLNTGAYGIFEPDKDNRLFNQDEFLEKQILMLVPGRAFTTKGNRLGRGKGFYDKYLSKLEKESKNLSIEIKKHLTIAGVCYRPQIVSEIETEPHDYKMDTLFF